MRIKSSKRGLTFSFKGTETFCPGVHYRYLIDLQHSEIILLYDESGKYQFSRKGSEQKPLVDLRNKEIRSVIGDANYLEIEILEHRIVVHVIKSEIQIEGNSDRSICEMIEKCEVSSFEVSPKELEQTAPQLSEALQASGFFSQEQQRELDVVFSVGSLFSGAGLLDFPFSQDESFDIVFACDCDPSACKSYRHNIGSVVQCIDIRELEASCVPECDVILAGPSCHGFSNSNRAGNLTLNAEQCSLVDECLRIVKETQPLICMIENVETMITKDRGKYFEKVFTELSDYEISYAVVTDFELGGYTKRKRLLIFASKKVVGKITIPSFELERYQTVGDALAQVDCSWPNHFDVTQPSKETMRKMACVRPGHNYKDIPEMTHLDRHSNVYRRLARSEQAPTLTNWRKVNLMPPIGNRILSVSEASALMGMPKEFAYFGTLNDKQQQVGNGVPYAIGNFAKMIIKNALMGCLNRLVLS